MFLFSTVTAKLPTLLRKLRQTYDKNILKFLKTQTQPRPAITSLPATSRDLAIGT